MRSAMFAMVAAAAALCGVVSGSQAADAPQAQVLKWKDGKKAVFLMAFDDSCASHLKNAIPALKKHGYVGTFYINPGGGAYPGAKKQWDQAAKDGGIEFGNHTFKHVGATSVEQLDEELAKCSEVIDQSFPDRKKPRLVSFGQPGGVPWKVPPEEVKKLLAKYHLVNRPGFQGPPFHIKTIDEMTKYVDSTIAKGDMGHIDFHGVGGDWHVASMEYFNALLDKLDASKDQLWVTDAVSYHKYLTERKAAEISVLKSDAKGLQLKLTSQTDPELYDLPLTVQAKVPAEWKQCTVSQGTSKATVAAQDGSIRFDALPNAGEISVVPAGQ